MCFAILFLCADGRAYLDQLSSSTLAKIQVSSAAGLMSYSARSTKNHHCLLALHIDVLIASINPSFDVICFAFKEICIMSVV